MKTKENTLLVKRKHLYKLLDSFTEKDLRVIESFASFMKKNRTENNEIINEYFNSLKTEEEELNDETKRSLRSSKADYKKGRSYLLEDLKKEIGI